MKIAHHFLGKEYSFSKSSTKYNQIQEELNRNKIATQNIFITNQIHSSKVIEVNKVNIANNLGIIEADGMITNHTNLSLIILTADCAPILLFDQRKLIIGAVHAGWRGAKAGILFNAIKKMQSLGAENIQAILGPMIRQKSYEVQNDFHQSFIDQNMSNRDFFINNAGKIFFDLPGYIKKQLTDLGVKKIEDQEIDTLTNKNFYSYRLSTINKKPNEGRNLSIITIEN